MAEILIATFSAIGLAYWGLKRLMTDSYKLATKIDEILENSRINRVAIEALRMVDDNTTNRVRDLENFLEKTTDFKRREY